MVEDNHAALDPRERLARQHGMRRVGSIQPPHLDGAPPTSMLPARSSAPPPAQPWTPEDSSELYNIPGWGAPYFDVNSRGHLVVRPHGTASSDAVDIDEAVQLLRNSGVHPPIILRFPAIIAHRLRELQGCFSTAIRRHEYTGAFRGVFPVKCNHDRRLILNMLAAGRESGFGLEAGSKAELAMAVALLSDRPGSLLICNGYKDAAYMQLALRARQLGINAVIVLQQIEELPLVLEAAARLRVRPALGVRSRLATHHNGHWGATSGDLAKFGLQCPEIMEVVHVLAAAGMLDCLQLLHFHVGSQISNICVIKEAMREAGYLYAELVALGAAMGTLDVGSGLAVDYEGTGTDSTASLNYSMQSYADDIVAALQGVCKDKGIEAPCIVSESGRALASHHSVMVFDVLSRPSLKRYGRIHCSMKVGSQRLALDSMSPSAAAAGGKGQILLATFQELLNSIVPEAAALCESYKDALYIRDEALRAFKVGTLSLGERAEVDLLFEATCGKIHDVAAASAGIVLPEALRPCGLPLRATYTVNFSVFRSAIDSWAIRQVFPICPISRLNEEPTVAATLADITCDSDGVLNHFISTRDGVAFEPSLPLHELRTTEPYPLAMFLTGVYQEVMGSSHNMLGAPHVAEIRLQTDHTCIHGCDGAFVAGTAVESKATAALKQLHGSNFVVDHLVPGENVQCVLSRAQHEAAQMVSAIGAAVKRGVADGSIRTEDGQQLMQSYRADLSGDTYLSC